MHLRSGWCTAPQAASTTRSIAFSHLRPEPRALPLCSLATGCQPHGAPASKTADQLLCSHEALAAVIHLHTSPIRISQHPTSHTKKNQAHVAWTARSSFFFRADSKSASSCDTLSCRHDGILDVTLTWPVWHGCSSVSLRPRMSAARSS